MKRLLASIAFFALAASAADVTGMWKGTAETPNGTIERTFVFKQDGAKLTGETTSEMMGKSTIADGKVEGDAISFAITINFQGNEMKVNYKGKVTSNEMRLTAESSAGGGMKIEYTAKKVD
jgi:hypothetical protein